MRHFSPLSLALTMGLLSSQAFANVEPLGSYNVDLNQTSVSGISSGGFMTVQLHAAHADQIVGIGVFAGGPYMCSGSTLLTSIYEATQVCMLGKADTQRSLDFLKQAAKMDKVAPLEAQKADKIWLFSGYNDGVLKQPTMDVLFDYYQKLTDAGNVYYKDNIDAGHAQITSNYGQECEINGNEFINDCDYDGAGLLLQHIYGELKPKFAAKVVEDLPGKLIQFDQQQFIADSDKMYSSMAETAYAYVPASCAAGEPCKVHVAFHGCLQSVESIGTDFVVGAGYNEWAETNHLIVLYPQTVKSAGIPYNPKGCWDWWGYTTPVMQAMSTTAADYAYKDSIQIKAIWKMVESLKAQDSVPAATAETAAVTELKLTAADSSDDTVALYWAMQEGVSYNLKRATGDSQEFKVINSSPIQGASYGDKDLEADTNYAYQLVALDAEGKESVSSEVVSIKTGPVAPDCDPYFGTASELSLAGRAFLGWGFQYYAVGSSDRLGGADKEATLLQTRPFYYKKGNCPENTKK